MRSPEEARGATAESLEADDERRRMRTTVLPPAVHVPGAPFAPCVTEPRSLSPAFRPEAS